ncbi:hypothetical protein DFH09DRAFT_1319594 [Mycena vulgaris]|nr:hypothetical protein DFH09DRAFT_1319594 [Mycena vulgaris]
MSDKEVALAALSQATDQDLDDYKTWLSIPSILGASAYFDTSNRMNWVKLDKYAMYLREIAHELQQDTQVSTDAKEPRLEPQKLQSSKHDCSEVIEISDDDDEPAPPRKKRVQPNVKPKAEPLSTPIPPIAPRLTQKFSKGRILISARESVEKVVQLKGIPDRMPMPDVDTAYIFDFGESDSGIARGETYKGNPKNLDRLLKAEASSRGYQDKEFPYIGGGGGGPPGPEKK